MRESNNMKLFLILFIVIPFCLCIPTSSESHSFADTEDEPKMNILTEDELNMSNATEDELLSRGKRSLLFPSHAEDFCHYKNRKLHCCYTTINRHSICKSYLNEFKYNGIYKDYICELDLNNKDFASLGFKKRPKPSSYIQVDNEGKYIVIDGKNFKLKPIVFFVPRRDGKVFHLRAVAMRKKSKVEERMISVTWNQPGVKSDEIGTPSNFIMKTKFIIGNDTKEEEGTPDESLLDLMNRTRTGFRSSLNGWAETPTFQDVAAYKLKKRLLFEIMDTKPYIDRRVLRAWYRKNAEKIEKSRQDRDVYYATKSFGNNEINDSAKTEDLIDALLALKKFNYNNSEHNDFANSE